MRATTPGKSGIDERIVINTDELQAMLGCGRPKTVEIGRAAGARIQCGRRVLWNVKKIQKYLDSLSEQRAMHENQFYGLVYQSIMRRKDLTVEAKAIYSYLCSFAGSKGSCYPGIEMMADELQMSKNRLYTSVPNCKTTVQT